MISTTEREYAITQLDQTRERLLDTLQGLSRDQLLFRPGPGRWSVAENVEHLVVAERRLVGAIDKLLEEPPDFSTQRGISDEEVVKKVGTALERVQSPSHSLPKLRWPAEQLLHEFETTRERTRVHEYNQRRSPPSFHKAFCLGRSRLLSVATADRRTLQTAYCSS